MIFKNNNYFARANELAMRASYHTSCMEAEYKPQIQNSIAGSSVYDGSSLYSDPRLNEFYRQYPGKHQNHYQNSQDVPSPQILISPKDTVSALFDAYPSDLNHEFTILNFASYKYPGGMFLDGSSAQEESLCHESILYNVLKEIPDYYDWNKHNLNKSLYLDRAIFSPDILFIRDNYYKFANVITCAAPNWSSASKYNRVSKQENFEALKNRIRFIMDVLGVSITNSKNFGDQYDQILILGAFGCGVFGQDAIEVAELFKYYIIGEFPLADYFSKIIFAIPPGENLDKFVYVFSHN